MNNNVHGQAINEYVLVMAIIAITLVTTLVLLKWPIITYLELLLSELVGTS